MTRRASQNPSPLVGEGFSPRSCASEALRKAHGGKGEGDQSPGVARARSLRQRMTNAERKVWHLLRDRRFAAAKFRRQVPLGPYVADFLSYDTRIVVEVDGGQHAGSASDQVRDDWFRGQGFEVVRFWNSDVLTNLEGVFTRLAMVVEERTPHPSRRRSGGETPSPTRGEGKRRAR